MAIKIIANYSKRLGLPGYSSHQFSVSVETELGTTDDVVAASEHLYQCLQSTVDEQMQQTGFVPPASYGMDDSGTSREATPANVTRVANWQRGQAWKCSDKQKDLILKLVEEHRLDKAEIESLAIERFGKGVRLLNKVEASGLIDELLETHGSGQQGGRDNRRNGSAYSGNRRGRAA
ncbi:MAG: hypothetical protein EOP85_07295 [Verrucomicrobiaceae bacterium]|nr:MAG: hypothetical protein EOP85_07295 [Verrucomicrobiaceae bacterium]